MQVHNTEHIGSYCTLSVLTPMTRNWSEGKTIYPVKLGDERAIDKDPKDMELQELIDTQNMELPTISRQSWLLTGAGAWSLDKPSPTTGTTIAERLPEEHPMRTGWKTTKPISEMTADEIRALEKWYAEHTRGSGMTPYKQLHPRKSQQIEWERWFAQCSVEKTKRLMRNHSGKPFIQIRGIKTDKPEVFEAEAKAYLRELRTEWGHVPTIEEIEERGQSIRSIFEEMEANNVGLPATWYNDVYLNGDHHLDPHNYDVFDAEYHSSYEFLAEPDMDIDEDFMAEHGLDPEDVLDAQPRQLRTFVRSKRDQDRIQRNPAHNDALWHARIGQSTDLGTEFPEPRTLGRIIADKVQDLWTRTNDADNGISALSILRD